MIIFLTHRFFLVLSLLFSFSCSNLFSQVRSPLPDYGEVQDFLLTERSEKAMQRKDLLGKIWISNFIFTRCGGPCPLITSKMATLQKELSSEVQFVSFSVDPEHDTPAILSKYAETYGAETNRWFFLTGKKEEIYHLIRNSFHIGIEQNKEAKNIGEEFIHSLHFVLVDPKGKIRGYYVGTDPDDLARIPGDIKALHLENLKPLILKLPSLNASLNFICALLLIFGYRFIRMKKVLGHKVCMISAFVVSILFLTSYLIYHFQVGSIPFQEKGVIRLVYFSLLTSHTFLAILIVPLILVTLYRSWKGDFEKHVKIARWTLPLWLYVSVTGVTIYWMLYW